MSFSVLIMFFMLILIAPRVYAGGAAAMKKRNPARQQQQMMQQQQVQVQKQMAAQEMQKHRLEALAKQKQVNQNLSAEQLGVQEVAGFSEVVAAMKQTGENWLLLVDVEDKETLIEHFVRMFKQQGIKIEKPTWYYVSLIDGLAEQSSELLKQPFDRVLQVVAIIEYDFDNGQNKDALALQIFGSKEAVIQNRARLGMH